MTVASARTPRAITANGASRSTTPRTPPRPADRAVRSSAARPGRRWRPRARAGSWSGRGSDWARGSAPASPGRSALPGRSVVALADAAVGFGVATAAAAARRDRLDRHPAALPRHPDPGVVPGREEVLELRRRQLRVRAHVVAVGPALETPQRPDDPDARDGEPASAPGSAVAVNPVSTQAWSPWATVIPTGRFVRRRFVTARAERRRRTCRSRRGGTGRRRSGAGRRPSRPGRRRPSPGCRTGCGRACTRSSAAGSRVEWSLPWRTMLRMIWTSAAVHHSHDLLGGEGARPVQVDAAGPARGAPPRAGDGRREPAGRGVARDADEGSGSPGRRMHRRGSVEAGHRRYGAPVEPAIVLRRSARGASGGV